MRPSASAGETELGSWGGRAYFSPKSCGGSGDTPQKQAGTAGLLITTDAAVPATKANTRTVGEASCFPLICPRPGGNAGWGLLSTQTRVLGQPDVCRAPLERWAAGKQLRGGASLSSRRRPVLWAGEQGKHGGQASRATGAAQTRSTTPLPPEQHCSGHHPIGTRSSSWPRGHGGRRPCPQRSRQTVQVPSSCRQKSACGAALAQEALLMGCRGPGHHADHEHLHPGGPP